MNRRIIQPVKFSVLFVSAAVALAAMPAGGGRYTDSHIILDDVFKSIDNVKTLTYTMVYSERLEAGRMHIDSNDVKFQKAPRKIYMKTSDGTEVLWVADTNKNRAFVHPNSFPYATLLLDPDGSLMRKDQHHNVTSTGYDYFEGILKLAAGNLGNEFDSHFLYLGEVVFNGVKCYNIKVIEPAFKYVQYIVQKGETVLTIAKKLGLSEYMILQHNNLNSYSSIVAGKTIMVPNSYAKAMTLYIDKTTALPVFIKVEDEKGLFEQYTFRNISVNPAITANEFSRKDKEYHF